MVTEAQKRAKVKYMSSEKGKQGQKRWSEKYRSTGKGKHNLQRLRKRKKLARALTQQRELFGLTKEELALKLKLDVTLVEELEAGTYYQIDEDAKTKNKVDRFLQKLPPKLDLPEELSESIVFLRKSFRKSQAWLSEQVEVSRQTISLWESCSKYRKSRETGNSIYSKERPVAKESQEVNKEVKKRKSIQKLTEGRVAHG